MRARTLIRPLTLVGALVALIALVFTAAHAQQGEVIRSFDVSYVVNEDGTVTVTEDILYDFGSLERHGIFRDIPDTYRYDPDPDYVRRIFIDVDSVTDGSQPVKYSSQRFDTYRQIKIGDPDKLVTGQQRYVITYTVKNALNPQDNWDEFFWNVTGNQWSVTIESASAVVRAPSIDRVACFQGPTGSTDPCAITGFPTQVFTATEPLPPGSGLTIVVALTKGSVEVPALNLVRANESEVDKLKDSLGLSPLKIVGAALLGVVGIAGVGRYWWLNGRDRWFGDVHYLTGTKEATVRPFFAKDTVVVEYTPPEIGVRNPRPLRPAEIGALLDERADTLDVTATIVDLAVRGYLKITEIEKKWIFGSKDYKLEKLKAADETLLTYESSLLNRLFDEGDSVDMSDLKNEFYKDLAKVKDVLYTQVVSEDKFFPRNPEKVRSYHMIGGLVIAGAGVGLGFLLADIGAAIFAIPVVIAGLLVLATSRMMPRRTPAGREMYRRVLGFREYMQVAETDRQRFYEEENIFEKYLPYAIVFGCVDKWAKAFEDMGIEPNVSNWYVGTSAFHAMSFSRNLNSFSSSLSSAIASTPGGSGGSGFSSGGGFSGGGGGGGGGGSW